VKHFVLYVAILLCGSGVHRLSAQTARSLPDVIDSIRPAVVKVYLYAEPSPNGHPEVVSAATQQCFGGSSGCVLGTGFIVNDRGDTVTALHVVDGYQTPDGRNFPGAKQLQAELHAAGIKSHLSIGIPTSNIDTGPIQIRSGTFGNPASVIATDPAHDLALIRPNDYPLHDAPQTVVDIYAKSSRTKLQFVTFSNVRARDAEPIFACGYPFGEAGLVTTSGTIASAWNDAVLLRATASGFSASQEVYNVDLRINPGNSGGPIFRLSDHSVIGVAVQSLGSLGIAVPAKFVTEFLTDQGVPWTKAEASQKQGTAKRKPK
jgi:S1-C subfamily serine protease